ncbi:Hermansky-Pudlak syndrome 5 protein [Notothenia coriiceps]|uniref:Hermansky-Pudlak syndrome 5 protein n=1 Tax=Notothenia coriiceps TaxID=8208 RepID=A0A6I9PXV7_9TELE|nr:PREDICTED: Hermansky-Pudlak syndrome 5 protein-like [Notothenia coriiceps]
MPLIPVVPENHSHVLAEFDCLDPLLSALRLDSGRLKKMLMSRVISAPVSLVQRFVLSGRTTSRPPRKRQVKTLSDGTKAGVSWEHRGQTITSLCWDTSTLRVFVGDAGGKVSFLRAGSSKLGKGSTFVIFPVQTVTTVDSRVVQLGYQDGRLLVSSLSRCYLCDTDREKFWRVGSKERDGEYGACFYPQNRGLLVGQPPLLYSARPGSRIWEASFNGEVLSTHQFKQPLACPPLPLITYRDEPHYNPAQKSPQSIAFTKLLYFGDQNLLTWTDSAIYIFTPQNGQVLLWTEVKGVLILLPPQIPPTILWSGEANVEFMNCCVVWK